MKAKLVYGCPCSGKSTYVREHAGECDLIYDYDALVLAATTRTEHLTDRHPAHFAILSLREAMSDAVKDAEEIDCLWMQCRWPTDKILAILDGLDIEEIFVEATKAECYERLMQDETRPDKDAWKAVIDAWFSEHGEPKQKEMNRNLSHFWNWIRDDAGERVLRLEGPVDEDSFWGDEVTPKAFRDELEAEDGDVTVWINSPGGNVFAAAEIYNMLCDHKGQITVKIDAIAASAASVIAMAGDRVLMSPVAMLMIHDPMTIAMGNTKDMERAIATLNEVKESIINAYVKKTGRTRNRVSKLMSDETWMNAKKAVELGFADEILFTGKKEPVQEGEEDGKEVQTEGRLYSARLMSETILNRICPAESEVPGSDETEDVEPPEGGLTDMFEEALPENDPVTQEEEQAEPEPPDEEDMAPPPVIGLDGKTPDGSMPYQILKDKLDFLR